MPGPQHTAPTAHDKPSGSPSRSPHPKAPGDSKSAPVLFHARDGRARDAGAPLTVSLQRPAAPVRSRGGSGLVCLVRRVAAYTRPALCARFVRCGAGSIPHGCQSARDTHARVRNAAPDSSLRRCGRCDGIHPRSRSSALMLRGTPGNFARGRMVFVGGDVAAAAAASGIRFIGTRATLRQIPHVGHQLVDVDDPAGDEGTVRYTRMVGEGERRLERYWERSRQGGDRDDPGVFGGVSSGVARAWMRARSGSPEALHHAQTTTTSHLDEARRLETRLLSETPGIFGEPTDTPTQYTRPKRSMTVNESPSLPR